MMNTCDFHDPLNSRKATLLLVLQCYGVLLDAVFSLDSDVIC